ncbi:MAG: alpha/beta hydrolase [Hyphomonadaceae bacterium]|nr:alpha/beta hydrolase [Hyphomonadaceae bacterium]
MLKFFFGFVLALAAAAAPALAQGANQDRLFAESRFVVRDRFSDEIVGEGPDLIFIGGIASRAAWKATAERLKGRYRLHLIQIAGFAGEPARANAGGEVLIPMAEALDAYLVEQKLTPAVLIGHWLGGSVTLYLAERHPQHLTKALIVDAVPFIGNMQNPPLATVETIRPQAERARDRILAAGQPTPEQIEPEMGAMSRDKATRRLVAEWRARSDHTVVARVYYESLTWDLRLGLGSVETPILVLHPDMAPLGVPPGQMEKAFPALYASAPGVRTKLVSDSLHFIMLDQPQLFADTLDAFLAD